MRDPSFFSTSFLCVFWGKGDQCCLAALCYSLLVGPEDLVYQLVDCPAAGPPPQLGLGQPGQPEEVRVPAGGADLAGSKHHLFLLFPISSHHLTYCTLKKKKSCLTLYNFTFFLSHTHIWDTN